MLKTLLKSKLDKEKSLEKLIDEFIKQNRDKNYKTLEEFLKSLRLFLWQKWDDIDKDLLKELALKRLELLNISFDVDKVDTIYEKMATASAVAVGASLGVEGKFVFDKVDVKAINAMKDMFYWTGTEYNKKTEDKLKSIIDRVFQGEIPRTEVADILEKELDGVLKGSRAYFEGVADHIINQSQNISRVTEAVKFGAKAFKVVARLDSRTSKICRSMHGRVIPAKHLENQANKILSAKSIQEKKDAATWKNDYHFGELPENFGLPPYHFRCRTMITPVWISEEEVEGKKMKFVDKDIDDVITHIDKTGVQRRVKKSIEKREKLKNKHGLSKKEVIGVLNDLKYMAKHDKFDDRFVALSGRGYAVVFEGEEVVTIFKPTRRATKYFNDNATKGTITDIDSGDILERVKKWFEIF